MWNKSDLLNLFPRVSHLSALLEAGKTKDPGNEIVIYVCGHVYTLSFKTGLVWTGL